MAAVVSKRADAGPNDHLPPGALEAEFAFPRICARRSSVFGRGLLLHCSHRTRDGCGRDDWANHMEKLQEEFAKDRKRATDVSFPVLMAEVNKELTEPLRGVLGDCY